MALGLGEGGDALEDGSSATGIDLGALESLANQFFAAVPGNAIEDPVPTGRAALGRVELPRGFSPPPSTEAPQSLLDAPMIPALIPPISGDEVPYSVEAPVGGGDPFTGLDRPSQIGSTRPDVATTPVLPAVPVLGSPSPPTSSPYYFLDEATALGSTPGARPDVSDAGQVVSEAQLHDQLAVLPNLLGTSSPPSEGRERYFIGEPTPHARPDARPVFDVATIRRDFPILSERVNGRELVWLDNAATTQKPTAVIERLTYFYEHENSNIHRAAHELAARATDAYEKARSTVARFIGAGSDEEIVFVRGTTEGINLIEQTWGRQHLREGDEIIISHLEHHANIVPWQQLVAETGAVLKVIPVDADGQLLLDQYQRLLSDRTKLVAVTQVSNALGTVTPIAEVVAMAHQAGALALVDGAQSVSHMKIDVQALDADFFVFSGHKVFGPTGIGVVYAKRAILDSMVPWQTGGNMILDVTLERATFQEPPMRFEAGTGNIADAVGLGAALEYVERIGIETIGRYEHDLLAYATHAMCEVPGLTMIGTAPDKASVLSFILEGYAPAQVGEALSDEGIAVRAGHHCAQPILRRFGLEATVRPSLAFYNTPAGIDHLVSVLHRLAAHSGRARR